MLRKDKICALGILVIICNILFCNANITLTHHQSSPLTSGTLILCYLFLSLSLSSLYTLELKDMMLMVSG